MKLNELQELINDFTHEHKLETPIEHRLLDLQSEVGELAKEVLKSTKYGQQGMYITPEFVTELGDVLYVLITIANHYEIDLQEALKRVIAKYEERARKGGIGSEHE